MPLQILVAIPTNGHADSIELRQRLGELTSPPLPLLTIEMEVDTAEFLAMSPRNAATRLFEPAVAILQNRLRDQGY